MGYFEWLLVRFVAAFTLFYLHYPNYTFKVVSKCCHAKLRNVQKAAWNKASKLLENFIVWSLMLSQTTQAYGGVQHICYENP